MFVAENLLDIYVPILVDAEKRNDYDKVFDLLRERFRGMAPEMRIIVNDRLVDIKAAHETQRLEANKLFLASTVGEKRFAAELFVKTPFNEYEVPTKTLSQLLFAYKTRCFHLEFVISKRQKEPEVNVYYKLLEHLTPDIPSELFSSKDF
ncbi:hypothetical protein B484DRAFT_454262 [Ochromonadaceae sp. CCMP2298]|nr:hypothetical protein B484DRAFT_454262 [Ochromonadaceae sp. CCMP2298]